MDRLDLWDDPRREAELARAMFQSDAVEEDALRVERQSAEADSGRIEVLFRDFRNEPL